MLKPSSIRTCPAGQIVAAGRDLAKVADLAERGVQVRKVDYSDPESLRQAFSGAEKVLLISGSEVGQRLEQHRNAITAAKDAGVGLIAYTSIANAGGTGMQLAAEHEATEAALQESGLPFTLLRNGWYLENYTDQLGSYLQHGAVLGSAGEGRVSAATRADYAHAAASVLLLEGQAGKVYELGGDVPFTLSELAEEVSSAAGQPVTYQDLPVEQYAKVLVECRAAGGIRGHPGGQRSRHRPRRAARDQRGPQPAHRAAYNIPAGGRAGRYGAVTAS